MTTCQGLLRPVLIVAALLIVAFPATGYEFYNGTNACVQCHDGFVGGFGAELHDSHNEIAQNCATCHASIGDNPLIENCASCHFPEPLWNLHNSAPADGNGLKCNACHTFTANDMHTWGETKSFFR